MQTNHEATSQLQADHYDRIAQEYARHYGDRYSQIYRDRFINDPLFEGYELKGRTVLEAMCGSGETTGYLLEKGAIVTGLDVSEQEIDRFAERWPDATAVCSSIFETNLPDESFDCAVVVGGLHHLHPHISPALMEIHRVLKPGGYLCFAEPHKGSISDSIRQFWYQHDDLFAANEEAIDVTALSSEFSAMFALRKEKYAGNLGYLFVLNSMVFRIPFWLKKLYSPGFLYLESLLERIQNKSLACMAVVQWVKR